MTINTVQHYKPTNYTKASISIYKYRTRDTDMHAYIRTYTQILQLIMMSVTTGTPPSVTALLKTFWPTYMTT